MAARALSWLVHARHAHSTRATFAALVQHIKGFVDRPSALKSLTVAPKLLTGSSSRCQHAGHFPVH